MVMKTQGPPPQAGLAAASPAAAMASKYRDGGGAGLMPRGSVSGKVPMQRALGPTTPYAAQAMQRAPVAQAMQPAAPALAPTFQGAPGISVAPVGPAPTLNTLQAAAKPAPVAPVGPAPVQAGLVR